MKPLDIIPDLERPIDPQAVRELYSSVGWWPKRQVEDIGEILRAGLAGLGLRFVASAANFICFDPRSDPHLLCSRF